MVHGSVRFGSVRESVVVYKSCTYHALINALLMVSERRRKEEVVDESLCNPLEIMFSCWLCFYLTILLLSLRVECYSFHKRSQTHHDLNSRRVWAFNGFADITNRLAKKFRY
jgi:hypothetical protein